MTAVLTTSLRAYRDTDRALLRGRWPVGELLGVPVEGVPDLVPRAVLAPPIDATSEVCVHTDYAAVRYDELDWIARHARLQIGVQPIAAEQGADILAAALRHAAAVLNLRRVFGWLTPSLVGTQDVLHDAGLRREATVPQAYWHAGRPVDREIWAATW